MFTRRLARPMLAAIFVSSGIDALRKPEPRAAKAGPVLDRMPEELPVPSDALQAVKLNAAAQIAAGGLLAIGRLPRMAATVLAVSLVPTTLAGHRFWEEHDPTSRTQQRLHFLKNVGLLGGLLLAAFDTGGAPSLGWRARRAARRAGRAGHAAAQSSRRLAGAAREALPGT